MYKTRRTRSLLLVVSVVVLAAFPGCLARFAANLLNSDFVPARFDGLEERRVAVIAVSNASSFGPSSAATAITKKVEQRLRENVKDIQVIDQQIIADWMDRNDWNQIDYQEVGEAVQADVVLAIDIDEFSLHDGPTLYRGRCSLQITVHDIANHRVVYEESPPPIVYPIAAGQHLTDTTDAEFRRRYINYLAMRIARNFHTYDATRDFGQDAHIASN